MHAADFQFYTLEKTTLAGILFPFGAQYDRR